MSSTRSAGSPSPTRRPSSPSRPSARSSPRRPRSSTRPEPRARRRPIGPTPGRRSARLAARRSVADAGDVADAPAAPHATPLRDRHAALGARLIDFAGWEMPVQYRGILEEHRAVRERAGLFDLSHMGELFVEGAEAGRALAYALVTNPPALTDGRAHYSMIVAPDGGILDDLIVYRLAAERYLVVANASNAQVVSDLLAERLAGFK